MAKRTSKSTSPMTYIFNRFEIAHDGVCVLGGSLVFLQDTNGDDKYDKKGTPFGL